MFSGNTYEVGTVKEIKKRKKSWSINITAKKILGRIKVGHCISISGACLPVTKKVAGGFMVEADVETLRHTLFQKIKVGSKLNLELPLRPFDDLGGHLVQGHVDGVGKILEVFDTHHDVIWTIELPKKLMKYVVHAGFIALDGVSLTGMNPDTIKFQVAIIPQTRKKTNFQYKKKGDLVNVEVDMMAKYLEKLVSKR